MSHYVYEKNFVSPWPFPRGEVKVRLKAGLPPVDTSTKGRLDALGAKLLHINDPDCDRKGTIVYRPCVEGGRMYQVSFAFCSEKDVYNKKIGAIIALARFELGSTVELPIGFARGTPESALTRLIWALE